MVAQLGEPGVVAIQPFQLVKRTLRRLAVAPAHGFRRQIGVAIRDPLHPGLRLGVAGFAPENSPIAVGGVTAFAGGKPVGLQMRGAFAEPVSDPVHRFGGRLNRERRRRRRRCGFAQLPAHLVAQRQQPAMIGNLAQTLFDVRQAGFIGAVALCIERPGQKFIGLGAALFSLGAQTGLFGPPLFFSQSLLPGCGFLRLTLGLLFAHLPLNIQQAGVVRQGLQALVNIRQTGIQGAFLAGALRLLQQAFGL